MLQRIGVTPHTSKRQQYLIGGYERRCYFSRRRFLSVALRYLPLQDLLLHYRQDPEVIHAHIHDAACRDFAFCFCFSMPRPRQFYTFRRCSMLFGSCFGFRFSAGFSGRQAHGHDGQAVTGGKCRGFESRGRGDFRGFPCAYNKRRVELAVFSF